MKARTVLYADEGMVLTDGTVFGRQILLADDADETAFREITEAEYEAAMKAGEESNGHL